MTTLTYHPDQGQPEFSDEELNSIAVGEQLEQEQNQLLAGKYESAEELERAYVELQQRFSSNESTPEEEEYEPEQEVDEEPEFDLMEALWQQSQDEYDPETLQALSEADPLDIAQAYLDLRAQGSESGDRVLEQGEIDALYDMVGGQDEYNQMIQWAANNCEQDMIEAYDAVMQKGDPASCYFAVQAMAFRMAEMEGWQPQDFLSGGSVAQQVDAFRSQAEVVRAMQDPRYDNDPAYRQDVMEKLERSTDLMY